jgi:hypothetical protein
VRGALHTSASFLAGVRGRGRGKEGARDAPPTVVDCEGPLARESDPEGDGGFVKLGSPFEAGLLTVSSEGRKEGKGRQFHVCISYLTLLPTQLGWGVRRRRHLHAKREGKKEAQTHLHNHLPNRPQIRFQKRQIPMTIQRDPIQSIERWRRVVELRVD